MHTRSVHITTHTHTVWHAHIHTHKERAHHHTHTHRHLSTIKLFFFCLWRSLSESQTSIAKLLPWNSSHSTWQQKHVCKSMCVMSQNKEQVGDSLSITKLIKTFSLDSFTNHNLVDVWESYVWNKPISTGVTTKVSCWLTCTDTAKQISKARDRLGELG